VQPVWLTPLERQHLRSILAYLGMRLPNPGDETQEIGFAQLRGVGRSVGAVGWWRSLAARQACSRSIVNAATEGHGVTVDSCLCGVWSSAVPEQVELVAAAVVAAGAEERLFRLAPELHRLRALLQVLLEPREWDGAAQQSSRTCSRRPLLCGFTLRV